MVVKPTVRTRILVPGDEQPSEDFYSERSGLEARVPLNKTAFREAERKYKAASLDFSQVYDFSNKDALLADVKLLGYWKRSDGVEHEIYGIEGVEGFKFVSGAMTDAEQDYFMMKSFIDYPQKPNSTNLDAHHEIPSEGLFPFFKAHENCNIVSKTTKESENYDWKNLEERFIRKIRWITLGYQYNWTTKEYNYDDKDINTKFPQDLDEWTREAVQKLGFDSEYNSEAGIVNFYQLGDTLTGHVDRSEKNMTAPLVSLSIGLSAIFLLGGLSREDEPVRAILVRSGDLSVLSGPSRLCFHGVPRILSESFSCFDVERTSNDNDADEDLSICLKLMKNCRININVRQVL